MSNNPSVAQNELLVTLLESTHQAFIGNRRYHHITHASMRRIKRMVHSRGQNIMLTPSWIIKR